MTTAILIPCYNEEESIEKVITNFKHELPDADIYVYDNNSTDSTFKIAKATGVIVKKEYKQGKGNVVRSMFRDIDADCYIIVDGDDTYPAESAKEIEKIILSGDADMVVGDRLSSTYFTENKRRFHNSGNKLVRKFINSIFNSDLKDIMSGYRGFNYDFVKSIPISSKEFEIETEMTVFALNHNFNIKEIVVNYKDRGENSYSKVSTYKDGYKIISLIFSLFRDTRPLFYFSLVTLALFIIAIIYFIPILMNFLQTGYVERVPTLIIISMVVIIGIITFLTGVILHVLKKQRFENFEHHLTLIRRNKK